MFNLNKRKKFLLTALILSLGFVIVQALPEQYRFLSIGILSVLTIIIFVWSLEGLGFNATLITLILPFFFTIGVGLFWFLLPSALLTKIPIIIFFSLGIYSLCLTANIYNVAAIRTIALLRAAKGVGFVLTLVTLFLIFDTILSFKWSLYLSSIVVALISFPLYYQSYWTSVLEKYFSLEIFRISFISSLIMGEFALALYFWPTSIVVGSLFLTVIAYMMLGLGQAELEKRFFEQTVREYLVVGLVVLIGMFIATKWGG